LITESLYPTGLVLHKHRNSKHTVRASHRSLADEDLEVFHSGSCIWCGYEQATKDQQRLSVAQHS